MLVWKSILFAYSSLRFRVRQLTGNIDVVLPYLLPRRWLRDSRWLDLNFWGTVYNLKKVKVLIPSHLLSVGKVLEKSTLSTRFMNRVTNDASSPIFTPNFRKDLLENFIKDSYFHFSFAYALTSITIDLTLTKINQCQTESNMLNLTHTFENGYIYRTISF